MFRNGALNRDHLRRRVGLRGGRHHRTFVLDCEARNFLPFTGALLVAATAYAELHCHTNFSFLDGASTPDELVERAVELGLSGLAITDHQGLYGVVRFAAAA